MSNFYDMFRFRPDAKFDTRDAEEIAKKTIAAYQRSSSQSNNSIEELASALCKYLPEAVVAELVRYFQERCSLSDKHAVAKLAMKIVVAIDDMRHFMASAHSLWGVKECDLAVLDDEPLTASRASRKVLAGLSLSDEEQDSIAGILELPDVPSIRSNTPVVRNVTSDTRSLSVEGQDKIANRYFAIPKLSNGAAESRAIVDRYRRRQKNGEGRIDDKLFAEICQVLPDPAGSEVFGRFRARRARSDPKALSKLEMELVLALSDADVHRK